MVIGCGVSFKKAGRVSRKKKPCKLHGENILNGYFKKLHFSDNEEKELHP